MSKKHLKPYLIRHYNKCSKYARIKYSVCLVLIEFQYTNCFIRHLKKKSQEFKSN